MRSVSELIDRQIEMGARPPRRSTWETRTRYALVKLVLRGNERARLTLVQARRADQAEMDRRKQEVYG